MVDQCSKVCNYFPVNAHYSSKSIGRFISIISKVITAYSSKRNKTPKVNRLNN